MSDLHKSFLRRIKHHERTLGLSLLSENDPDIVEEEGEEEGEEREVGEYDKYKEYGEDGEYGEEINGLNVPTTSNHHVNAAVIPTLMDDEIRNSLESFKSQYFSTIESYTKGDISFNTYYTPPKSENSPLFICVHGAGSSAMTFAKFVENLSHEDVGIFAYDLRGHGNSSPTTDFSMDTLVQDFHFIFGRLVATHSLANNTVYLVGHSLGGAILAQYTKVYPDVRFKGLVLLDIVEETAVKSLIAMPQFISNRPQSFPSYTRAIDWHMNFLLFNRDSASLSVCDLMKDPKPHHWKTDLHLTSPYWNTWFGGLSQNFLDFNGPKLLLLSTHEALDKDLIIGQMQGKYQLVTFNNNHQSGHFVHEDLPLQVAICLLDFIKRNESPAKFMREELGIVPKWGGKINK